MTIEAAKTSKVMRESVRNNLREVFIRDVSSNSVMRFAEWMEHWKGTSRDVFVNPGWVYDPFNKYLLESLSNQELDDLVNL